MLTQDSISQYHGGTRKPAGNGIFFKRYNGKEPGKLSILEWDGYQAFGTATNNKAGGLSAGADYIKKYGADAKRREEIGRAGYEATKRSHVWTVRWDEIEQLARPVMAEYAENKDKPADRDEHLAHELGLSACAGHYEKLGDTATATIAIDEWLALNPTYYTNLLAKGRLSLAEKRERCSKQKAEIETNGPSSNVDDVHLERLAESRIRACRHLP